MGSKTALPNSTQEDPSQSTGLFIANFLSFLNTPSFIYGVLQFGVLLLAPSGDLVFY
jgi:hypothetical protein